MGQLKQKHLGQLPTDGSSVNSSFGKQINNQIGNLPDGTSVKKVIFIQFKR